ncbi:carboxypeptidase regulatory-like domain-containing protein, partial [bacterium]|nr:carboxypeptidase regulatory-like domain-containing protein [bacterium]
ETGSIGGEVTTLSGDPIEDATVYYGGVAVAEGNLEFAWGSVTTDENGEYTISDLTGGMYGLFVIKSGHIPSGRVVHLSPGENKNSVDFNLIRIPDNAR